ncbi:hypothetical protein EV363DRAFT_274308 [Boletus edulis]|nr:hypothetical protein EV363DRAFT_274308 [Boletus edulis]
MNSDYWWQVNTWIPDGKEPPPSYEDVISDYHKSPMLSSDALPEDDHQSLGHNEFRRQPEEGTSALEQRSASQAIRATNDRGVDESKQRAMTSTSSESQGETTSLFTTMPRTDEGAPKTVSPIITTESSTAISTGSESRGTNIAEDDKQAKLDHLQFARKMLGSYEQPMTQLSSDREGRTSSDHMDLASTPNAHALATPEPQHASTLESFDVDSGTQVESTDSMPESLLTTPSGEDTISSSSDAHGMQGSLDYRRGSRHNHPRSVHRTHRKRRGAHGHVARTSAAES